MSTSLRLGGLIIGPSTFSYTRERDFEDRDQASVTAFGASEIPFGIWGAHPGAPFGAFEIPFSIWEVPSVARNLSLRADSNSLSLSSSWLAIRFLKSFSVRSWRPCLPSRALAPAPHG